MLDWYGVVGVAAACCLAAGVAVAAPDPAGGEPAAKWENDLRDGLVIAAQSDTHHYNRVPKEYLHSVMEDLPRAHADLFFLLGDICGPRSTLPDVARRSPVPCIFEYGDHDDFEEWGHVWATGPLPAMRAIGSWYFDPFNFMRARASSWQGYTGFPYGWSMTYRGIHFVVAPSCKWGPVTPDWFLEWLEDDLARSAGQTTVVLAHRGFFETGGRGRAERFNRMLERSPQVKLLLYGHIHEPGEPARLGQAVAVRTEMVWPGKANPNQLSFEGGYYLLAAVTKDAVRVWARYLDTGRMALVSEQRLPTTVTLPGAPARVRLPYLMADGARCSLPVLKLHDPKLRVWGVEDEQLVPNALFDRDELPWQPVGRTRLGRQEVAGGIFPTDRVLGIHVDEAKGSPEAPAAVATLTLAGVRWAETTHTLLCTVQAPAGRNVWMVVDTLLPNGEVEASYTRKLTIANAAVPHFQLLRISSEWLNSLRAYRWCPGPKGHEEEMEFDKAPEARKADRIRVSLATPDVVAGEEWRATLFVYTGSGFYMPIPEGTSFTRRPRVVVGGQGFEAEDLHSGRRREWSLPDLAGGTPVALARCGGSRVALVELEGETDGLQWHQVRQVRESAPGRFILGDPCDGTPAADSPLGFTAVQLLRPGRVGATAVAPKRNSQQIVEGETAVEVTAGSAR